ncbi:sigma-54 interaction domain-containing protein [Wansuia hejianensis]|uniref:Sigma 54-interacting transcriptional regulator n=1 Tax=Wansuia hejianensis TaxID=2763667 RepID=A0A926IM03_9FIRM|nr:sigma 54-interacting transcriptional regulator [Wansuia hejianensis]MBC8590699.1 sigma 54-interacting transcriptional regulator [Wansuia hejianensis]
MLDKQIDGILLQKILQHSNVGIHAIDEEGYTLVYNQIMAKLEGLEAEYVIGKNVLDIFPSLNPNTSTLMKVVKSGQAILNKVQTYVNFKGFSITTISSTIPLIDDGRIIGAIEIANNMTNLKLLSEQILELQSELNSSKTGQISKEFKIKKYYFSNIIGRNKDLSMAKKIAKKASKTSSSVLIYGETGTGKEMFAQSIHNDGIRRNKPFIAQNCAAIPESLLEGILFGTEKGGFTGAVQRKGIFEQARDGTLLLDEINSMSLSLQAKLLRVLQEGYIRRIGGTKDIPVNVRIIATTNEDPIKAMENGTLRKDLYYRLCVINIRIPSLRERLEDLELLSKHFIDKYNYLLNKNIVDIQSDVLKEFRQYSWPGNIRELENFIESAMNMVSKDEQILKKEDFLSANFTSFKEPKEQKYIRQLKTQSLPSLLEEMEKDIISNILELNNNNITNTAKALGIKRQTLQYKLKKFK